MKYIAAIIVIIALGLIVVAACLFIIAMVGAIVFGALSAL